MPLPTNFNSFEHLQDQIRLWHNKLVREYFSDLNDNNGDWEPDVETPRRSLRTAVTMRDDDTDTMTLMKLYLFYDVIGYGRQNLAINYGQSDWQDVPVEGHPKVCLYFSQDKMSVPDGELPVDAEYSFRLMKETQSTINETKARTLANEIKRLFVTGRVGIVYTKGKNIYSYYDKENGYRLRVYSQNETDGTEIIKKLLELTNTPYQSDRLSIAEPKRSNTATTQTQLVYGEQVRKKRFRPTANVRFRYAYMIIPGKKKPVFLIDTTYRNTPLVVV